MSKIFEKNSVLETIRQYYKRFAGWVIDSYNKYWSDIFFRTEFNVIALQIIFAIVLSVLIALTFNYVYKDILQTVITGFTESIKNTGTVSATGIFDSIELVKTKNFFGFFSITMSVALLFSYFIAKTTLTPTREALKSQKRFVSDIAHELRTPLSVIKTNCEVALLDGSFDAQTKKIFKNNIEELDRASAIINNLLTFSNLVKPEQIQVGSVNMSSIIDTSIKKLDDLIKKKEIKLTIKKISPNSVWGNTIALEQIVINIIKNAINYNHIGGSVTVSVEPDYRGNIVLSVEDSGVGISQDDLVHIFEPFYRAERSRNRQSGSSGLGLTIVSELVKFHSGRISVRSRLKLGTTVTIVLPYSKSDSPNNDTKLDNEVSVDFLKRK